LKPNKYVNACGAKPQFADTTGGLSRMRRLYLMCYKGTMIYNVTTDYWGNAYPTI